MPCGRGIRRDKGRACLFVRRVEREKKSWSERKHKKDKQPTKHSKQHTLEQQHGRAQTHEHVDMENAKATQENYAEL